jgi:MoxR-like ATPase
MIEKVLIGLFTGGHILLEGVPGLAKSLTINTLSRALGLDFKRIQFTPDLLPSDIIGTEIYEEKTGEFKVKKGPVFTNLLLADEINRAPAKVQSALLEAMQEKQVTIGDESYDISRPFLVMATQNPIEQDGTYPLPEAQQDRFLMKVKLEYPSGEEERQIIDLVCFGNQGENIRQVLDVATLFEIRKNVEMVEVDNRLKEYIVNIAVESRKANPYILCGLSPRASISLVTGARAKAYIEGRNYVIPNDIRSILYDVLRHRLILSYEAEAEGLKVEDVIDDIMKRVILP